MKIRYENETHWIAEVSRGYVIYKKGATHSKRCGVVGYSGPTGLARACKNLALHGVDISGMFLVICTTKKGEEIITGSGAPMTERGAGVFARAHRGGVGEKVGNRYTVHPLSKHKF